LIEVEFLDVVVVEHRLLREGRKEILAQHHVVAERQCRYFMWCEPGKEARDFEVGDVLVFEEAALGVAA
jgi:hypothetical protein